MHHFACNYHLAGDFGFGLSYILVGVESSCSEMK